MARIVHFCFDKKTCFDLLLNKCLDKNKIGNTSIDTRSVRACGDFSTEHAELLTLLKKGINNPEGNVLVIPSSLKSWPTIRSGTALDTLNKNLPNHDLEFLMKQNKPKNGEACVIHLKGKWEERMNIDTIVVMPIDSTEETNETLACMYLDAVMKLRQDQKIGRQVYLVAPCTGGEAPEVDEGRSNGCDGQLVCTRMAGALGAKGKVTVVESANADQQTETTEHDGDNTDHSAFEFGEASQGLSNSITGRVWVNEVNEVDGVWQEVTIKHFKKPNFSPSGHYMAVISSEDATAHVCELVGEKWQETATLEHFARSVHLRNISYLKNVSFSSDEKHIVTILASDHTVHIWSRIGNEWQKKAVIKHTEHVNSVNFSLDGKRLVTASDDRTAQIWKLVGGQWQTEFVIQLNESWINHASFSSDGKQVVIACVQDNSVKIWELDKSEWKEKTSIQHPDNMEHSSFSFDDKHLVTVCDDNTARIWAHAGEEWQEKVVIKHAKQVDSAQFTSDGKHLVTISEDKTAHIWELTDEEWKEKAVIKSDHLTGGYAINASFSPDGKQFMVVNKDGVVHLWECIGKKWQNKTIFKCSDAEVMGVGFISNKHYITAIGKDKTAKIYRF
ncbi:MAG: hypothetical protein KAG53_09340 [Endozoicomonadaceae bacterium]|nr:hypothetical protein [Endozoicomonadaceae bacterium]